MFLVTDATENIRIMETIRNWDCSRYASLTNGIQFVVSPGAVMMPGQPKWILHSIGNPYCHMNATRSVLMTVMMVICYSILLLLLWLCCYNKPQRQQTMVLW